MNNFDLFTSNSNFALSKYASKKINVLSKTHWLIVKTASEIGRVNEPLDFSLKLEQETTKTRNQGLYSQYFILFVTSKLTLQARVLH